MERQRNGGQGAPTGTTLHEVRRRQLLRTRTLVEAGDALRISQTLMRGGPRAHELPTMVEVITREVLGALTGLEAVGP